MEKEKIWNYHTFDSDDVDYIADKLNTTKTVSKVLNSAGFNAANSDQLDRFISPKIDEILSYDGLTSDEHLIKSFERMALAKKAKREHCCKWGPRCRWDFWYHNSYNWASTVGF